MRESDKAALLALISAQIKELAALSASRSPAAPAEADKDPERKAATENPVQTEIDSSLSKQIGAEIKLLRKNLDWLKSENAGLCEGCGCEIPIDRLMAVPYTQYCVGCAEKNPAEMGK